MNDSQALITVSEISKSYNIYARPEDRLRQSIMPRVQRLLGRQPRQYFKEFKALNNINFEVMRGETVGIIGRNGSGKSTLLQIICGTVNPTTGFTQTKGRVAALLELGSGFNPEFTGRENIYLNAAILGLSISEVSERFDDIVSFADIDGFIDQPVKNYSSGMMVRLAFAVQAQVDPDILIVDEALAVGDAKFQAKCFERLKQLKENGSSILLVTHSSEQIVTHCSRAILLDNGEQLDTGDPNLIVNRYHDILFGKPTNPKTIKQQKQIKSKNECIDLENLSCGGDLFSTRIGYNPYEYRWGDGCAKILDFGIYSEGTDYKGSLRSGSKVRISFTVNFITTIFRPIVGLTIKTKEGITVFGANSETLENIQFKKYGQAGTVVLANVELDLNLGEGDYFVSLGIASLQNGEIIPHDRRYDSIHLAVGPNSRMFGIVDLGMTLDVIELEKEQ